MSLVRRNRNQQVSRSNGALMTIAEKAVEKAIANTGKGGWWDPLDSPFLNAIGYGTSSKKKKQQAAQQSNRPVARLESAPVAIQTVRKTRSPVMAYSAKGFTVRHREYVGEVNGSVAFTATAYPVNPGLTTSFPWLALLAQNFQHYKINNLSYHFETEAATTAAGSLMLTLNPDAADPAPVAKVQAMQYPGAIRGPPWTNVSFQYTASAEAQKDYFTRGTTLGSNLDIKTYDVGNFYICTQAQATAALIGELYVEYDITFKTPQIGSPIAGGEIVGATAQTAANPFGTAAAADAQSFGLSVDTASNITFQNTGLYTVWWYAAGTVISALTITATSGCTVTKQTDNGPAAATSWIWVGTINVTSPGAIVACAATATTITSAILDAGITPLSSTS